MTGASIKKIWKWIKTMMSNIVSKLPKLLPRRHRFIREVQVGPEPAPHVMTPLEKKLGREIQKKRTRGTMRAVDTRQGSPNMPRYQPCSRGHGQKRRKRKTMGGAYYGCKKCGDFFVRSPGL